MIKKILLVFALLLNVVWAECHVIVSEPKYNLVVWLHDGETNLFRLAEHPVAEYKDGSFILRTSQTEVIYEAEYVRKFTLQDGDVIDDIPFQEINLVVWLRNGETNIFRLAEHPVAEYKDGSFIIRTSQTEVTYDATSVRKFTLQDGDIIDAVPYIAVPKHEMHYDSGNVEISNGKANSPVMVYTSGGVIVDRMRLDANGYLQFSTAGYSSGIYIIKTETTTFKILKK